MPEGLRCATLWAVAGAEEPHLSELCATASTAPPAHLAWLGLGAVQMEALPGALGNEQECVCSLAGSRPFWRAQERLQMRVRKHRANVDSFTRAGVVGKAHSDCFAAQLSVPWTYKTP